MSNNKNKSKIKQSLQNILYFLKNPEENFKQLKSMSLEIILEDYMKGLLLSGLLAGIISFLFSLINAAYLEKFHGVTIEYLRLINYSLGNSVGIFFFYLFIGTFGIIIIATLIWIFMKKIKYFEFIKIICLSTYPLLLFSWIYTKVSYALMLWVLFNIIVGIKTYNKTYIVKNKLNKKNVKKTTYQKKN